MRVRILVALSVCLAARAALAAACNGGSCPAANLIVSNVTSPQSAGTVSSVRVEARTSNGATATLYAGKIHFTSTDAKAVLPADYTFTSADQGVHVFTKGVTLKTAGTQSVTATDTKTATIKGSQTGIVVNALAVSSLAVSGISTPRSAGVASSVTVKAIDVFGNTVTSYTGTIHFSSSDPAAVLPPDFTFTPTAAEAGFHTFTNGVTLKTTGTQSVTATDVASASITGSQTGIVVNPAAAASLIVSGIVSPRSANTASNVTVQARDSFGTRATGYTGTVHFTSTDAAAVLPAKELTKKAREFLAPEDDE